MTVAVLILLGSIAIGALLSWLVSNPIPIIVMAMQVLPVKTP